jgi:hypothetical protein
MTRGYWFIMDERPSTGAENGAMKHDGTHCKPEKWENIGLHRNTTIPIGSMVLVYTLTLGVY